MSTRRVARPVGVVALLVMAGAGATVIPGALAAQPSGPILNLTVTSSRVSLTARETPLADVLAAISRQAGVRMVLRGDLNASITETLVNVPLADAIQRLSRWHSVVLIYAPSPDSMEGPALTEAWVTSSYAGRAGATPGRVQAAAPDVSLNDARTEAHQPTEPERWARTLIAFKDADPQTRSEQIEALVRAQGEHAIVAALREMATGDPAPRTRRAAIQVLASMGSPDALAAVQAGLADAHRLVRSEARTALRQQSGVRSSKSSVD